MPPRLRRLSPRKTLFSYVTLVLGGILLGWNIAQFWSYVSYTLVFAVNEILFGLCGLMVYLFIRGTRRKEGKNGEGKNTGDV